MKKALSIALSLVFMLCICLPCFAGLQGTTYYVDGSNGDDSASGTSPDTAWKSLDKATANTYSAGDKILLKAGEIFNGRFVTYGSGSADTPIVLGAYGDTEKDGLPIIRSNGEGALLDIYNVSGWTVENIEFTNPNGSGLVIASDNGKISSDITVRDCVFHDICNKELITKYPINLSSSGEFSRLNNITIKDCNIYDCGYGIAMGGLTAEWTPQWFKSPEESYNTNYLIDGVSINNLLYDGIIIGSIYGMTIRNCSILNTCLVDDHYTAPMWSHHASNFVVENCEIAGALNEKDGMAVDFDGWTTDSVYQCCYSHDNVRFIRNCCYDNYTCNDNCIVRYCLSVNDNKGENSFAQLLTSGSVDYKEDQKPKYMTNFGFYNNTIINSSEIYMIGLKDAYIANNIFVGDMTSAFLFSRKTIEDDKSVILKFDGKMTNNCFRGTPVPSIAKNNYICNPGFVGNDLTDKNSFMLSKNSKLIGKGAKVADDMGEFDFYGNALTDNINIGCYGGEGENQPAYSNAVDNMKSIINTILGAIYNFIYICNDTYWIF